MAWYPEQLNKCSEGCRLRATPGCSEVLSPRYACFQARFLARSSQTLLKGGRQPHGLASLCFCLSPASRQFLSKTNTDQTPTHTRVGSESRGAEASRMSRGRPCTAARATALRPGRKNRAFLLLLLDLLRPLVLLRLRLLLVLLLLLLPPLLREVGFGAPPSVGRGSTAAQGQWRPRAERRTRDDFGRETAARSERWH